MKNILLIEDDLVTGQVYEDLFHAEGYGVSRAEDGERALEILKASRPDLVVLDLMLPKIPGILILKHIRMEPTLHDLPVIVFSNGFLQSMVKSAISLGASRCLTKAGCTPEQLLEIVRELLKEPGVPAAVAKAEDLISAGPAVALLAEQMVAAPLSSPPLTMKSAGAEPAPSGAATEDLLPKSMANEAHSPAKPPAPALSILPGQAPIPSLTAAKMHPAVSSAAAEAVAPISSQSVPMTTLGMPAVASALASSEPVVRPEPHSPAPMGAVLSTPRAAPPPPVPQTSVPVTRSASSQAHANPRRNSMDGAAETASLLLERFDNWKKLQLDPNQGRVALFELYRVVHGLVGGASVAGRIWMAHAASALEALLQELFDDPSHINASTMRTIAHAVECLFQLLQEAALGRPEISTSPLVFVVDDDDVSRQLTGWALETAGLRAVSIGDPLLASAVLENNRADLIFLDVQMPQMSGFDLCVRLRASQVNKTTPIVFITSLSDFESRACSTLSGGTDIMAKPILQTELAVKALSLLIAGRNRAAAESALSPGNLFRPGATHNF